MPAIMFRCNAGHTTGYGHVSRCLSLANALSGQDNIQISFVLDCGDAAKKVVDMGFGVHILSADRDESFRLLTEEQKPDILILDARPAHNVAILRKIKQYVHFIADLDDTSDQRFAADVVYLPPAPAVQRLDWQDFSGVRRIGFHWILTGGNFLPPPYRKPTPPYHVLMTMGGSDPWNYTQKYAPLFAEICKRENMVFAVVIGPGFAAREDLAQSFRNLPYPPQIFDNPGDMGKVYDWCDIALAPTSVSAYELAMSCKKCLYLCPDEKYREYGMVFEQSGLGKVLDLPDANLCASVQSQVRAFIQAIHEPALTPDVVKKIFVSAPAKFIANDILTLWKQKR
ncbi:MAG: acylneuraminate cytidylyltransferase [Deltaproteobacteria bacterium]|nr:acylneuraminate cytidylyltransferase [Deltaproteobacteria bacterium]